MSTFTETNKVTYTLLDGPTDLTSQTKTSFVIAQEAAEAAAEAAKKAKESE